MSPPIQKYTQLIPSLAEKKSKDILSRINKKKKLQLRVEVIKLLSLLVFMCAVGSLLLLIRRDRRRPEVSRKAAQ